MCRYYLKRVGREFAAQLKNIWLSSFDDDEDTVDEFFDTLFDKCVAVGAFKENELVASQYLIPCEFMDMRAYYGYAVATHPSHRGRGICTLMQREITAELYRKNIFYFLSPADDSLASYYKRIGFGGNLFFDKAEYDILSPKIIPERISAEKYLKERNKFLFDRYGSRFVRWEADILSCEYDFYTAKGFCFAVSYANESLHIAEFLGTKEDADSVLLHLDFKKCKKIVANIALCDDKAKKTLALAAEPWKECEGYFAFTFG